jgi:hypothetical protein
MIRQRVAEADVVFAVWQDDTVQQNVGFMPIKGQHLMRRMVADSTKLSLHATGIKCIDGDQGEAPFHLFGAQDRRR